ncbi:MAG: crotonase/enoyl-CoA hydratase family protein [Acidimicrobiales bacterium]
MSVAAATIVNAGSPECSDSTIVSVRDPLRSYVSPMVEFELLGHIAVLTLNRPEARNAVNGAVAQAMESHIDRIESDDDIWLSVLTGAPPVFCAGADLKEIASGNAAGLGTERGGFAGITRRERTKPIIAAVDGPALAGGTEIVLSCDLVVASSAARFGIPEVKRSLLAAGGGLFRLPQVLPRMVAMELALTGDPMSAERAYHFGLVNELVDAGGALTAALGLGERICANAPIAVRESRRLMLEAQAFSEEENWQRTNDAFAAILRTEDFAEGPLAFIEKRAPVWKGR